MDNFVNIAKQGWEAYQSSQGQGQGQGHHPQQPQQSYNDSGDQYGQQEQGGRSYYPQGGDPQGQGGQGGRGSASDYYNNSGANPGYDQQGQGGQGGGYPLNDDSNQYGGGGYGVTGGPQYNRPNNEYNQRPNYPDVNQDHALEAANAHYGGGNADHQQMLSQGLDYLKQHAGSHQIDEQAVQNAHQQVYSQGSGGNLAAGSIGSAAALQILQKFTSGNIGGSHSQLIGMAMSEAGKIFDQNGAASGNKQDAINGAAATIGRLLLQNQSTVGGGNSGGLGGLASLAGKFLS